MCTRPATSREHVPPRCLFPPGNESRKALISVPSCDEHNNGKSTDDDFISQVLALASGAKSSAVALTIDRVTRAVQRAPKLMQHLLSFPVGVLCHDQSEELRVESLGLKLDMSRFDDHMSTCARALYFDRTKSKFFGVISVITSFTLYAATDVQHRQIRDAFRDAKDFFSDKLSIGENPEVFFYKWDENQDQCIMLFTFYTNLQVLVRLDKRNC